MIEDSSYEIGEPRHNPYPPDDADFTWHVHDAEESENGTWGTGIVCSVCAPEPKEHNPGGKTIHWNIARLKQTNEAGVTVNEMRQEIYADARETGRDITRV